MTTKQIIRQIARNNNVTPKQVEEDIKEAIRAAMASDDPQAQAIWRQIAPDGDVYKRQVLLYRLQISSLKTRNFIN